MFEDTDGCPDTVTGDSRGYNFPDSDGDGIEDRWDQCINERENYNKYLDWDGCPDVPGAESTGGPVDSDSDGIYDFEDLCPTERETKNKYNDADGCPDVAPGTSIADSDYDGIIDSEDACPTVQPSASLYLFLVSRSVGHKSSKS